MERLQLSTHYVDENTGTGRTRIAIKFMYPQGFCFDQNKLNDDEN